MIGSYFTKLILIVLVIGMTGPARAHTPSEIGYEVDLSNKSLTIHTTQKGLLDLLIRIDPGLTNSGSIQLYDHTEKYTAYFNNTIMICLDETEVEFIYEDAHLIGHDATLRYSFKNDLKTSEIISLNISSFTEIYRRTKNIVIISKGQFVERFYLNRRKQYCEYNLQFNLP